MSDREHPYAGVERALAGSAFSSIRYVAETASTNRDAAELLGHEAAAGLTIVAEYQTRGSGRKGRSWRARPGSSLLFTTILPHSLAARQLWALPFWTALAVRRALASYGVSAELHWPNDLLLGCAKIAGILCVSRNAGEIAWAACGVGINVARPPEGDDGIRPSPAFCDDVAPVERPALLRAILLEYDTTQDLLADPECIARRWETEAGLPGRRYRLLRDHETVPFEATAVALAAGGGLAVVRDDGTRETISLADARALRQPT